ncbi:MAG: DNA primase [Clostridiaceae bacterium]|nr:DNA primase [Clostridiaceae bacterium]
MHKYIPEELIEEIRASNDIVDVVSEYVRLEKKGKYFFGLCPFHREKTPSFSVTPSMQIFNCFGCNKGGNVIHFIMNIENLDFIEAVEFLAERAGIKLPEEKSQADKDIYVLRQEILEINKTAARYFHENINTQAGMKAREYLRKRGVSDKTVKIFGLGYSPAEDNKLYKYLLNKKFRMKAIIESGLVIRAKRDDYIDRFRNRLMFPIFDIRGNVIGFGGRVLDDSSLPKYMNSPETLVYKKGSTLYAMNFARNSGEGKLIVVEGYMDVISLHQHGIINSVASLGTALTSNQGRILRKYAEEIIISFDADAAGQAAVLRSLDLLSEIGCKLKVLNIPEGKDPDDFIRKWGIHEFKKLIDNAESLVEYKINNLEKQLDTDTIDGKIKFINKAAEVLSKLKDRVEIEIYVKNIAGQYGISEESLHAKILEHTSSKKALKEVKTPAVSRGANGIVSSGITQKKGALFYTELFLFAILCIDNSLYELVKDRISADDFTPGNRAVADVVLGRLNGGNSIATGELLNIMDIGTAGAFTKIIERDCSFEDRENMEKAVLDVVNKITAAKLKERKMKLLKILRNTNNLKKGEEQELLNEISELVRELKKISITKGKER